MSVSQLRVAALAAAAAITLATSAGAVTTAPLAQRMPMAAAVSVAALQARYGNATWFAPFAAATATPLAAYGAPGPFAVGLVNASQLTRGGISVNAGGPVRDASVFFPCSDVIGCAAVAPAPRGWPVVIWGIGWNSWSLRYAQLLSHISSYGFIVVAPSFTDNGALATHRGRAVDQAATIAPARVGAEWVPPFWALAQSMVGAAQWLHARAAEPGLLSGAADTSRVAFSGHSSGGGSFAFAVPFAASAALSSGVSSMPTLKADASGNASHSTATATARGAASSAGQVSTPACGV